MFHFQHYYRLQLYQPLIQKSNWPTKLFKNQVVSTETRSESAVWLEFSKNRFTLVTLEQIWRSYIFRSQMALQSVIKIDHTLSISISISIWVVDQSLAHDQQKVIKRSNRSRSAIDHHKSAFNVIGFKQSMVIQIGKTRRFGYRVLIKASFRLQPVWALRIRIMSVFKKYETKKKTPKKLNAIHAEAALSELRYT